MSITTNFNSSRLEVDQSHTTELSSTDNSTMHDKRSNLSFQQTYIKRVRKPNSRKKMSYFRNIKHRLNSEDGFTITEVLAAVAVSTILIGMAAVAIFTFYTKFKELSLFAQLQQDAFDAVETIKYGYPFDIAHDYVFLGIANARSLSLEATGGQVGYSTGIICYPEAQEGGGTHDYVRYFYDRDAKAIRVQSLQGIRFYQDQIFPRRGDPNIEVTSLRFSSLTGPENPRVVSLELHARVIVSEDKIRYITYKTNVALGR